MSHAYRICFIEGLRMDEGHLQASGEGLRRTPALGSPDGTSAQLHGLDTLCRAALVDHAPEATRKRRGHPGPRTVLLCLTYMCIYIYICRMYIT